MYAIAEKLILCRFHVQQTTDVEPVRVKACATLIRIVFSFPIENIATMHPFDASGIAYYTFKA